MATANLNIDKTFYQLIKEGHIRVQRNGRVLSNTGKIIKGWTDNDGYTRITMRVWSNKYTIRKHRLIWIAFNGLISDSSLVINHKNGKKQSNSLRNLELVTESDNLTHAWNTGLRK